MPCLEIGKYIILKTLHFIYNIYNKFINLDSLGQNWLHLHGFVENKCPQQSGPYETLPYQLLKPYHKNSVIKQHGYNGNSSKIKRSKYIFCYLTHKKLGTRMQKEKERLTDKIKKIDLLFVENKLLPSFFGLTP